METDGEDAPRKRRRRGKRGGRRRSTGQTIDDGTAIDGALASAEGDAFGPAAATDRDEVPIDPAPTADTEPAMTIVAAAPDALGDQPVDEAPWSDDAMAAGDGDAALTGGTVEVGLAANDEGAAPATADPSGEDSVPDGAPAKPKRTRARKAAPRRQPRRRKSEPAEETPQPVSAGDDEAEAPAAMPEPAPEAEYAVPAWARDPAPEAEDEAPEWAPEPAPVAEDDAPARMPEPAHDDIGIAAAADAGSVGAGPAAPEKTTVAESEVVNRPPDSPRRGWWRRVLDG